MPRRLHLLAGLELGLTAIGHALRWQARRTHRRSAPSLDQPSHAASPDWVRRQPPGAWPETAGRRLLALTGVPMVTAEPARSPGEAVAAAARVGYPVAVKLTGAGIAHKSDAGGVALGLSSPAALQRAYTRVLQAAAGMPDADVDGVLISPMRAGGHELLAGVTVDPTFGAVLAVGLGGVWVEALQDVALRVLPIDRTDAREMLEELRGAALLRGWRGAEPVDLDRVADVLLRISEAAGLVAMSLRALEVNPLWCRGDRVEGLDVLVVTDSGEG